MYAREGWGTRAERVRHAQALAAAMQGASTRRDGKPWVAAHFIAPDPWAPPPPAASKGAKGADIVKQVKVLNRRNRRN